MAKLLEKIESIVLVITTLLVPLVIFPLFPNPFGLPKLIVLVVGVSLVILLRAVNTIIKGSLTLHVGKFDLPILALAGVYLASAIINTPNKMEAFFFPGSATFVVAATIYYFLSGAVNKKALKVSLFISGLIYSLVTLLAFVGILNKIPQLPEFMKDTYFSLDGSVLVSAIFLATILPLGINLLLQEKGVAKKLFYAVSVAILILGLGLNVYNLLPGKPQTPAYPSLQTSWAVATEAIKESPALGIGVGNYLSAFNAYRPGSYNATNLWNLRFASANNFYLNVMTEAGLLGLAAVVLLLVAIWKALQEGVKEQGTTKTEIIALAILVILSFVFPLNSTLIFVLIVLLAISAKGKETSLQLSPQAGLSLPTIIVTAPFIVGVLVLGYFGSRAVLAEMNFQKALNALSANDGKGSYEQLIKVINASPYVDRYHAAYAQINLALATSLAQKKDLTETEKNTVTQLIQQAIREGKSSVTLNIKRSGNWEILAKIYQSVMPIAQGADSFTVESYSQAISLDPLNPNLRIALGGVYYALGNYDEAIKAFELAVLAKPDLANAHYNLAVGYREKNEIDKAIEQMNLVLSLVAKDSKDYEVAKAELENLEKKKPVTTKTGDTLTTPQTEKQLVKPPIKLPEESTPPAQ